MSKYRIRTPRPPSLHPMGRPVWNQVQKIAGKFGGKPSLARALDISRITVYFWDYAAPRGNGLIPARMIPKIQAITRIHGILLTAEDWAPERIVYADEVEAAEEAPDAPSLMSLYDQAE